MPYRATRLRRFTSNRTMHVDWGEHQLFLKVNPHHDEALAEQHGHARVREFYPVPRLHGVRKILRWTVLAYDRWPHLGTNHGLILDEITRAETTGEGKQLDTCLDDILNQYEHVIARTLRRTVHAETVSKLYGDRVAAGGRIDSYYGSDDALLSTSDGNLRPSDLARMPLIINGAEYRVDLDAVTNWMRDRLSPGSHTWAAMTQGDPTDVNIGWTAPGGPVWFDYDTGGPNALAGEFACFLLYQRLHGAWLTPKYNPRAFRDHPLALKATYMAIPKVSLKQTNRRLAVTYWHAPSPTRRHVMNRYLEQLVRPLTAQLGIDDLMDWLRPYLAMRLLAVYDLGTLEPEDSALCLALLAETLSPTSDLAQILGLTTAQAEMEAPR